MVGYVLLIVGVIAMAGIVYVWLTSYIPRGTIECPDGVSLFIQESSCTLTNEVYNLKLNIKNNGRFSVDGYYIRASTDSGRIDIATTDISNNKVGGGSISGVVSFSEGSLTPTNSDTAEYNLESQNIYLIEIIPIMYETQDGRNIIISCGNAKVREKITCS